MGLYHNPYKSIKYALEGIKTAFANEPNLRIHTSFAITAVILGLILKLDTIEWLILTFTIFFVVILELLNTMLENLVDLVSPEMKPHAKVAKDVSAGMVLLATILSVIVGLLLFVPKVILLSV